MSRLNMKGVCLHMKWLPQSLDLLTHIGYNKDQAMMQSMSMDMTEYEQFMDFNKRMD